MTPELECRRRAREAPFDGDVVALAEIDLGRLQEVLAFICARLAPLYPRILLYHDWHEHDGYVTHARAHTWEELLRSVSSAQALYHGRDDDWGVRLAVHPESFEWLLRFNVDEEDPGNPSTATGDFDLACSPGSAVTGILDELESGWTCERGPALAYFAGQSSR